jgi:hypothetical protein
VDIEVAEDMLSFKIALWDGYQNTFIDVFCLLTVLSQCRRDYLVELFETQLERLRKAVDDVG